MLKRITRRVWSVVQVLLGRCSFCGDKRNERHLGCPYCNDDRFCHKCTKTFYFASLYGYRYNFDESRWSKLFIFQKSR